MPSAVSFLYQHFYITGNSLPWATWGGAGAGHPVPRFQIPSLSLSDLEQQKAERERTGLTKTED